MTDKDVCAACGLRSEVNLLAECRPALRGLLRARWLSVKTAQRTVGGQIRALRELRDDPDEMWATLCKLARVDPDAPWVATGTEV